MASLPVYDTSGKKVGTYDIEPTDLAASINKQLLHDAVVMYQANRRQATHRTRSRAEVSGSTRKIYRQKGTGNARAGSRRSGIRRGGGHIFAKRPRDYSYRLPRKALRAATRMAIAGKIQNDQLVVLNELSMDQPRTKDMDAMLGALSLKGISTLITTETHNANVYKSARNIQKLTVSSVADLNALSVIQPQRLVITRAALDTLKKDSGDN